MIVSSVQFNIYPFPKISVCLPHILLKTITGISELEWVALERIFSLLRLASYIISPTSHQLNRLFLQRLSFSFPLSFLLIFHKHFLTILYILSLTSLFVDAVGQHQ